MALTIGYWDIRGLAAPLRMMCEYAGVTYENKMYSDFGVWMNGDKPGLKEKNPLINLPYVLDGDKVITQSQACFIYLAKKLDLCGGSKRVVGETDDCKMLEYLFEVFDVRNAVIELVYPFKTVCRTEEEHKEKTAAFCGAVSTGSFAKLEAVLACSGGPFLMGEHISAADFHLWEMIDQLELMAKSCGGASPVAECPKLAAFHAHVRTLPQLKKYFESDMAKLPVNNVLGGAYFM